MSRLGLLLAAPVAGPLLGLGWLARRIADAAEQEMANPARIEAELLRLEAALEAGALSLEAFEAREAELLAELDQLRAADADAAEPGT